MDVEVAVVGRGPSGLLFASLVAQQGGRVALISDSQGTLPLWGGHWDFRSYADDGQPIRDPYAWYREHGGPHGDPQPWRERWLHLQRLWQEIGVPVANTGDMGANRWIMTPLGHFRPTYLTPAWHFSGSRPEPVTLVGLPGLVDFSAEAAAAVYRWTTGKPVHTVVLDAPPRWRRDWNGLNWAWFLDSEPGREWLSQCLANREWPGGGPVVFPQVLGVDQAESIIAESSDIIGRPVAEVPLPPPSVGGIRVARRWERWLKRAGATFISGHAVSVTEQRVQLKNGRRIEADRVVLAAGGILGGGLVVGADGVVRSPMAEDILGPVERGRLGWAGYPGWDSGTIPVVGRMVGGYNPDRQGNGGALTLWTVHEAFEATFRHAASAREV